MIRILTALLPLWLAACSVVGNHGAIEEPPYEVVSILSDDIEIRQYADRIAVETTVTSDDPGDARNAAFRLLFAYISGANEANAEIAMTVPVETPGAPRTIAMTAPVESQTDETGAMTMRFFLPGQFTHESAPVPTDHRVRLVQIPAQRYAVLTFSGSRSEQAVSTRLDELRSTLQSLDLDTEGSASAFFYDPPWTLPWFRRNEVTIEMTNHL